MCVDTSLSCAHRSVFFVQGPFLCKCACVDRLCVYMSLLCRTWSLLCVDTSRLYVNTSVSCF